MNINCHSIRENNSEFKAAVDYIKPDIICGTESWLKGVKPGNHQQTTPSKTVKSFQKIIMSLEMTEELLEGAYSLLFKRTYQLLNVWTLSLAVKWTLQKSR